jgi:hypothetical protein
MAKIILLILDFRQGMSSLFSRVSDGQGRKDGGCFFIMLIEGVASTLYGDVNV